MSEFNKIKDIYNSLSRERDKYTPLWKDISKFVGISVDVDSYEIGGQTSKIRQLDEYVDDPTAAIATVQFGDYLLGLIWGSGNDAFSIVPSRYVLEEASAEEVQAYYDFVTEQTKYHFMHPLSGFYAAMRPFSYDFPSFGNGGVGCFKNRDFINKTSDNALVFKNYGIDSTCIGEGKNGLVDYFFTTYRWTANKIINEFCITGNSVDEKKLNKLPQKIRDAWNQKNYNSDFKIIHGIVPREDYDPRFIGARAARFKGVWFSDDADNFFLEEDYIERPISWARMIKVRNETYGRGSGTMLLSAIRAENHIFATSVEVIEKMASPSLGVFSNSIFGDSVLDDSPRGLTVFNQSFAQSGNPAFPLYNVGDPSALVQYLIPYLNEKITTAFKIDMLLDFSAQSQMTATETLQRSVIRGQSIAGIMGEARNFLYTLVSRGISILASEDINELGVDADIASEVIEKLTAIGQRKRIRPEAVSNVMRSGKPWFDIRFNNEIERLSKTQAIQNLNTVLQSVIAIASVKPEIIEAVDWYKLLADINNNVDANNQILLGEFEFKEKIAAIAQQQQAAMMLQAGQAGASIQKDTAQAAKLNKEANAG